jgi:Fe-S oxidoreductase
MRLIVTALFWLAAALLLTGLIRRTGLWRAGRAAPVRWSGLLAMPKRYLVDLHHVVARDPYIARTHVAVAGGAVATILLVAVNYGLMLYSPLLDRLIHLAAGVMVAGAVFVWLRRRTPPARLSRGPWDRLPFSLAGFGIGLILLTATPASDLAFMALLPLALGAADLALGIGMGGPMKHAVAGLLHLAFHPRPERFAGQLSTGLKALDLDKGEFGVAQPVDFAWNRLLSFDACVQCGKCEAACPAFAAGQPLNPKKLVQDLVVGLQGGSDAAYTGSPYPGIAVGAHSGGPHQPIIGGLIEPETLWSCTTCRACVQECPMLIEHVDAIIDLRRDQTLVHGDLPGTAPDILANLRETATAGGYDTGTRYHWATDLNVRIAKPGETIDLLLMAGESAFDLRAQRTLRSLVTLLKAAGTDFALLGPAERDCGDTARRLGDEATFQSLARQNISTLNALSFQRIVTADPHVMHCLKNEYPSFGGLFRVQHHTTLLAELDLPLGKLKDARRVTYHDPCYLGRYNGETTAPRALLASIGIEVAEMARSGLSSRCCGGGGGAPLTDIPGEKRIPDIRMADARATGAGIVAVGCPNCTAMLEGVVGDRPDVLDIAELLVQALEG